MGDIKALFTWGDEFGGECEDEFGGECEDEFVLICVDEYVCFFEWI